MKREKLKLMYEKYGLEESDVFKHQHYLIITRQGIDKIQALEQIEIHYNDVRITERFAVIKATAEKDGKFIQTYGSALKGDTYKDGNTNSWYVVEMAEKRAMSRAVLKITGMYELGVFGEDESESFKRPGNE